MTDYREINNLQRDIGRTKQLAEFLLLIVGMRWTDWELSFLKSIVKQADERLQAKDKDGFSTRQVEILVELHDESVPYPMPENFSIKSLVNDCLLMQHLLDVDQVEFIKRHKAAGTTKLRRREVRFLFACARKALAIEDYQGWRIGAVDEAA